MHILVGTLVFRQGAYVLDKFLANQRQIQQQYPQSELLLATAETDYCIELKNLLDGKGLRGSVISYEVARPDYSRSYIWNITCGREAVRKYVLSQTRADGLLFLDADMTYDPRIIGIMLNEMGDREVIFSGSPRKDFGLGLSGAGCLLMKKEVLEKINFRCYEYKNGDVIPEDSMLEMDLFRMGIRSRKGFFVSMDHYVNVVEARHLGPRKVGIFRRLVNNNLLRYWLIRTSISVHRNIPVRLQPWANKLRRTLNKVYVD